ncbi:Copper chaperone CopZ [Halogranum rubrum]|uniref:Copper chaperone CopZ n=1 Tax=Halogranum rubrum TaxID=553466 RepID=A0A1I4GXJ2_9EURY|nr:heavy-metal-associated domain-containing protein [Halogranum rubrum]SFL34675.1 Copper chaperone CopZ [Halogranum rubrum]
MAVNEVTFTVRELQSEDESRRIRTELENVEGVMGIEVDDESGETTIRFDHDLTSEEAVTRAVHDLGYEIE